MRTLKPNDDDDDDDDEDDEVLRHLGLGKKICYCCYAVRADVNHEPVP